MQDILGSVRRSLVFRSTSGDDAGVGFSGFVEKIGSSIRKSRIGLFSNPQIPALPPISKTDSSSIRWRKGELIGCGAFGRVYMGMNLDSGELLAVKQVAALFHIGTTKSHPPIPDHLSSEAKDFLLKCLQNEKGEVNISREKPGFWEIKHDNDLKDYE
ncbi:hypothetical protein Q3G72_035071 [Acer saccharum]|nr:hypothetical protein Q3G72_035071 [Acer saccharum]